MVQEFVPVSHQPRTPIISIDTSLALLDHLVFAPFIYDPMPQLANDVPSTISSD